MQLGVVIWVVQVLIDSRGVWEDRGAFCTADDAFAEVDRLEQGSECVARVVRRFR